MARKSKRPAPDIVLEPMEAGPPEAEAGGILTIDLAAIAANWRTLAAHVMPSECAAVVKANAYGCGIEPVTAALARAGCRTFFVAHIEEARRVRRVAAEATIYVLNGYSEGTGSAFVEFYARPVINSAVELAEWDHFVATSGWLGGAAIHVDTGMNRLGMSIDETAAVAGRLHSERHGLGLLMSHFACADRPDHPLNDRQIRQFRELRALFRGLPSSLANSPGIFLDEAAHCDLVRPGAALYGVNPTPGRPNPMRMAIELSARVLQVRSVPRGASVGYGAAWTAPRLSRIAVIAAGYADGLPRAVGASLRHVEIGGQLCPIVGHISMDLVAVDVTGVSGPTPKRGDWAILIGGSLDIDTVAAQAGTIAYEILAGLGHRYRRIYKV